METKFASFDRKKLMDIKFDNSVIRSLPLDPVKENYVRRSVADSCFSLVNPTPISNPQLVAASEGVLDILGIDPSETKTKEFAEYLAGNKILPGSEPAAHCYCGFQFGYFSGQLGDGRAIYLGELINPKGERWELQLKGAGKTPYSRDGDGRAVLRSSIREFLCSEAMYHLGIPTTRAASVITSDTFVVRDLKYDGNPIRERATVVLRVAPTFLRFGSFQICLPIDSLTGRSGSSPGKVKILIKLMKFMLKNYFPEISGGNEPSDEQLEEQATKWFQDVTTKTAKMVAEWQCVGFTHGVLNTDNMSVLGLTIDYGPFGFMDDFNSKLISNGSDHEGRYCYENQPSVCKWNLVKLSEALEFMIPSEISEKILSSYEEQYKSFYNEKMKKKIGILGKFRDSDNTLLTSLFATMQSTGADFTNTFRSLSTLDPAIDVESSSLLQTILKNCAKAKVFISRNAPLGPLDQLIKIQHVSQQTPQVLAMFGLTPEKLEKEIQRAKEFEKLKLVTDDDKMEEDKKKWVQWLKEYRDRVVEDSKEKGEKMDDYLVERRKVMNGNNPKVVLRNYIAQNAIEKAEKGDYSEVQQLLNVLKTPFDDNDVVKKNGYDQPPPESGEAICVTCSS